MKILSDSKFSPKEYKHLRPRVYPGQIPSYIEINTQDFYRLFAFVKGKTVPFPLLCSVRSTVTYGTVSYVSNCKKCSDLIGRTKKIHFNLIGPISLQF